MNLMTVTEFALRIGATRSTGYRIVAAGQVDTTDIAVKGRPRLRISEDALERYVAARTERVRAA